MSASSAVLGQAFDQWERAAVMRIERVLLARTAHAVQNTASTRKALEAALDWVLAGKAER